MRKIVMHFTAIAAALSLAFLGADAALAAKPKPVAKPKTTAVTVKGPKGQTLTVSLTKNLPDGGSVTAVGKGYDPNTGIYLTFCVIPAKGARPDLCGPFDVTGAHNDSYWISNNPPVYAALLVKHFDAKGGFSFSIKTPRFVSGQDCKLVKCAVLTRADHTDSGNRNADVIVPVTFK